MKILFVDGEPGYQEKFDIGMGAFLKKRSYELDFAKTSRDALNLIKKNNYDVVITESVPDFVKGESPEEYLEKIVNDPNYRNRKNFRFSSCKDSFVDEKNYAGVQVAQAAKKHGSYLIGVSPEPAVFTKLAKEFLDVNYQKPFDIMAMRYLITEMPSQKEFDEKRKIKNW